jgi:hypothetical protein
VSGTDILKYPYGLGVATLPQAVSVANTMHIITDLRILLQITAQRYCFYLKIKNGKGKNIHL